MKFVLLTAALVASLCTVRADVNATDINQITAQFSSIANIADKLNVFTNQQLEKSFDYLLLAFTFDKYDLDRPGFEKLYRKISDKAWEDTQGLIKYQSKRGLSVSLNGVQDPKEPVLGQMRKDISNLLASDEISSLKLALDYEKILAKESHTIHREISHAHGNGTKYDPDVAHYLDEEVIEYQSGVIRKLAGYIHTLNDIIEEPATKELGIHMFDEYLDKAE